MRPMLATRGTHVPAGDEWQHEVKWDGMRVLVDVARRRRPRLWSRNENDATVSFPELRRAPGRRRCCSTARWSRSPTGAPTSARWPSGCTSRAPTARRALAERLPGHPAGLRPAPPRRPRPARRAARRSAASCSPSLDLHDDRWQVPPAYDDGRMLFDATYQQGLEGIVSKRAHQPLPAGPAQQGLAEVRPPPPRVLRRRRLAPRDRLAGPARRACWWASRPPTGCSTAAGSAAASPAGRPPMLREVLRRSTRDTTPFADEVPQLDALGTTGSSRCWSSTSSPSARPPRAGSASRRTSASAPT